MQRGFRRGETAGHRGISRHSLWFSEPPRSHPLPFTTLRALNASCPSSFGSTDHSPCFGDSLLPSVAPPGVPYLKWWTYILNSWQIPKVFQSKGKMKEEAFEGGGWVGEWDGEWGGERKPTWSLLPCRFWFSVLIWKLASTCSEPFHRNTLHWTLKCFKNTGTLWLPSVTLCST